MRMRFIRFRSPWAADPRWRLVPLAVLTAAVGLAAGGSGSVPAPPDTVKFPSHVGEVVFPHALHVDDLGIDCQDCHHRVTAPELTTPHPTYLEQCSGSCDACHGRKADEACDHNCGHCHSKVINVAHDRVPSPKVALHRTCGACHEIGTGPQASAVCSNCHGGPMEAW